MSRRADHRPHVRRVVLPSGKTIEVVYFEDQVVRTDGEPAAGLRPTGPEELHRCGSCASGLVHPVEWSEAGTRHWEVTLRCPNCEWSGTGVFDQESVERFDEELDRGTDALVEDLHRLATANMEDEIVRFAAALSAGHIVPEDF